MAEDNEEVVQRFWGMRLPAGKPFTLTLTRTELHVTQVTATHDETVTVMSSTNLIKDVCVAVLHKGRERQALVDLNYFPGDETVTFSASHDVYLAGSIAIFGGQLIVDDSDEEDEEEEEPANVPNKAHKQGDARSKGRDNAADGAGAGKASSKADASKPLTAAEKLKRAREASKQAAHDEESETDDEEMAPPPKKQQKLEKPVQKEKEKKEAQKAPAPAPAQPKQHDKPAASPAATASGSAAEPGSASNLKEMAEGLIKYKVLKPGVGDYPKRGRKVVVAYEGRLKDGKVFDSSLNFSFRLGVKDVIEGWDRGVATMRVGEKRRLIIHPTLAYGSRGAPPDIPPNATLTFDVELIKVL
jgi:FK506-binding nuclear protein